MKKYICLLIVAFLVIGAVSAQGFGPTPPVTRVEGTLQLHNGHIALSTGTAVYFVPGLMRYVGFIDGLSEGARVSVEGFIYGDLLHLNTLTIGDREYSFGANAQGWGRAAPGGYGCCGYGPMRGAPPMSGHHGWGRGRGRW